MHSQMRVRCNDISVAHITDTKHATGEAMYLAGIVDVYGMVPNSHSALWLVYLGHPRINAFQDFP